MIFSSPLMITIKSKFNNVATPMGNQYYLFMVGQVGDVRPMIAAFLIRRSITLFYLINAVVGVHCLMAA
jgi:hypothetical protein